MKRERIAQWASRIVTFVLLVLLVGMLPFLSGKDPAASVLRARSTEQLMTDEALTAIRANLGLGRSAFETVMIWLGRVLHGDFGDSWVSGKPVLPVVTNALLVSLSLMVASLLVAACVAALLCSGPLLTGLRGESKPGSGFAAAALTALPEFLLGSLMLIVLSVWLGWFPPYGWGRWEHYVLPALTLGIPTGGYIGRLLAEVIVKTFREQWVFTWQMSGWSNARIVGAVLRRSLPAIAPQIGLVVVGLTGGAVAVEQIFSIPGIGRTALVAAASSDLPTIQASVMILLVLGMSAGVGARLVARVLLGSAMDARSLAADSRAVRVRKTWWIVPALCTLALVAVTAYGLRLDPFSMDFARLAPPGSLGKNGVHALFGADASGRDVAARVAHGTFATVGFAVACALVSWAIGLVAGLIPGVSVGPIEGAKSVPTVIAGLLVATVFGPSAWGAALAVLLVSWAPLAAHSASLRAEVMATQYSVMAPLLGISRLRFVVRTVIPSIAGSVFRHSMLRIPGIALALASLGFLGLGPQPPAADWGLLLAGGIDYIERAPWVAFAPMAALIVLSGLAVSVSGRKV